MTELANLIRWVFEYALSGGFWHFVGVYLIAVVVVRIFAFVRVDVKLERKAKDKEPS